MGLDSPTSHSRRQIGRANPAEDMCAVCGATMDTHFTVEGSHRLFKGCRSSLAAAQRAQRRDQAEGLANILVNIIAAQHGLTPSVSLAMGDLAPDLAATFRRAARVAVGMLNSTSEDIARHRARVAAERAIVEELAAFNEHFVEFRVVAPFVARVMAAVVAEYALAAYLGAFDAPSGAVQIGDPS